MCGKRRHILLTLVVLCGTLLAAVGCDGQGAANPTPPRSDTAVPPSLPLVLSESVLNLGDVPAGGQKQGEFWLTNRTAAPVEVSEIETSCDCLTIDLKNRVLSPGQKVVGKALLDLRREPGFTGTLSIDVTGKGQSGQVVFTLAVKVAVDGQ